MSASKARGTAFESALTAYLRSLSLDAERIGLSGNLDCGDIVVKDRGTITVIEAKNTTRLDLAGWWKQAEVERQNYANKRGLDPGKVMAVVAHKRRNAGIADSWITLPASEFFAAES